MRILLDTQVVVTTAMEGIKALPLRVRRLIEDPDTIRLVSVVTTVELAIKTSISKFYSTPEWLNELIDDQALDVLPFTQKHALEMYSLPLHHREPFDRMIIAVALSEKLPLVGGDAEFPLYCAQGLSLIWR